jgi:hypothetical protein
MQIELSMDEAQQLVNLIDAAVRATGLANASAAIGFVQRIQQAASAPPVPTTPTIQSSAEKFVPVHDDSHLE